MFRTLLGIRERSKLWETNNSKKSTDVYEENCKTLGSGGRETWVRVLALLLNLKELQFFHL